MEDSGRRPQQLEAVERPAEPGKGKGREERRDTASFVVAEVGDVLSIKACERHFLNAYVHLCMCTMYVHACMLMLLICIHFCLFHSVFTRTT